MTFPKVGDCNHRPVTDFAVRVGEKTIWKCSCCGKKAPWGQTWMFYGCYECPYCWGAAIEWVVCSKRCRVAFDAGQTMPEVADGVDVPGNQKPGRWVRSKENGIWYSPTGLYAVRKRIKPPKHKWSLFVLSSPYDMDTAKLCSDYCPSLRAAKIDARLHSKKVLKVRRKSEANDG